MAESANGPRDGGEPRDGGLRDDEPREDGGKSYDIAQLIVCDYCNIIYVNNRSLRGSPDFRQLC